MQLRHKIYFLFLGHNFTNQEMLKSEIQNISINEVYSSLNPGKLLHSVISGPYENRSAANNSKEKITKNGFDPRLRTTCKQK